MVFLNFLNDDQMILQLIYTTNVTDVLSYFSILWFHLYSWATRFVISKFKDNCPSDIHEN